MNTPFEDYYIEKTNIFNDWCLRPIINNPNHYVIYGNNSVKLFYECLICHKLCGEELCEECSKFYKQCQTCGNVRKTEDFQTESLCKFCYENMKECESCHRCFLKNDIHKHNGKFYCRNCFNEKYQKCYYCNKYFAKSRLINTEHPNYCVCRKCYKERFFTCKNCNRILDINQKSVVNSDYCSDCAPYNEILSYSYKPFKYRFMSTKKRDNVFMGIELEITGAKSLNTLKKVIEEYTNYKDFYFKKDGSIEGIGFEVVSHPYTLNYHLTNAKWKDLYNTFENYGINKTNNCGLHVHFPKDIFDENSMAAIDCFVNMNIEMIQRYSGRSFNRYCYNSMKTLENWGKSDSRYEAVNFSNNDTVELRFCKSASNYDDFVKRITFLNSIVNFIIKKKIKASDIFDYRKRVENKYKTFVKNNYQILNEDCLIL